MAEVGLPDSFLRALEAIAPVKAGESLGRYTTFGVGGPADAYAIASSARQVADIVRLCRREGVPFFVLGSGSNIVIGDRGIRGVTIGNSAQAVTAPRSLAATADGYVVRADAGCSFAAVARHFAFAGFAGLEWACGIPGTLGGAVVYNAGAYGGCLGDVLRRITVASEDGDEELEAASLGLVYRASDFTRGLMVGRAVISAEFTLWPGDAADLRQKVRDYDQRRLAAQPRGRNAGSFFKNPPAQPAWKLLDAAGLRGYQVGGAQLSEKHCNFMVNAGGATAADVAALKAIAQQRVRAQFGIELDNEVALVGEGFGDE
ncbi:MAG TPA: UDP-N-acetylmuramate dehydrogenase [Dehalococcoidia bacterium]